MRNTLVDDDIVSNGSIPDFPALNDALIGETPLTRQPPGSPEWLERLKNVLNRILSLPENWDSYGAAEPDPETVRSAYGFLLFLCQETGVAEPHASPTRNGGILFEWVKEPHELEVDIMTPHTATYVYENTETQSSQTGQLFVDDADDGVFLGIVREHFGIEV